MLGVRDYEPEFYTSVAQLLSKQEKNLRAIAGMHITETWLAWYLKGDRWFAECPVVVRLDDLQLEICARNLDELAVTWNRIDLAQPLDWYGAGDTIPLEWRKNPLDSITTSIGKRVDLIQILEYSFRTTVLLDKVDPSRVGKTLDHGWLLHGLEFKFDAGYLTVYNGLDKNDIMAEALSGDDLRKTPVW